MMWGLILELKQSIRSKKVIGTLGIMLLLYVPFFYILKRYGDPSSVDVQTIVAHMIDFLSGMSMFFIAILALLMGATAINSEIEKGTLRIALSKPISRLGYIGGKMLAQAAVIFLALLFSTAVAIAGLALIGAPLSGTLVREVFLLNMVLFLGLVQLLFLGYLLSTFVKSSTTALGLALVLFFVISLIAPAIVTFIAMENTSEYSDDTYQEYATKYLFFDPTTQVNLVLKDRNEMRCYEYVEVRNSQTGDVIQRNTTEIPSCNDYKHTSEVHESNGAVTSRGCYCNETYAGIAHSVGKNKTNFAILIGMTFVYGLLTIWRFLRMDLR